MYIDDPTWKGPRCRFCGAPVKGQEEQAMAERIAKELQQKIAESSGKPQRPITPAYFCSDECVRARYIG